MWRKRGFILHLEIELEQLEDGTFMASAQDFPLVAVGSTLESVQQQVEQLIEAVSADLSEMPACDVFDFLKERQIRFEYDPAPSGSERPTRWAGGSSAPFRLERTVRIHELAQRP